MVNSHDPTGTAYELAEFNESPSRSIRALTGKLRKDCSYSLRVRRRFADSERDEARGQTSDGEPLFLVFDQNSWKALYYLECHITRDRYAGMLKID